MESNVLQQTCSTTAGRKVTKMQIICRLGIATRSCWEAQKQNEETLLHNWSLRKKVSKSKDVVEELRTCLKGACQEVRSTKSELFKTQHELTTKKNAAISTENKHHARISAMEKDAEVALERVKRGHTKILSKSDSKLAAAERTHAKTLFKSGLKLSATEMKHKREVMATEMKHKREVNTITNMARADLTAKDDLHALELEEKNKEISVSPSMDIIVSLSPLTHNFVIRP